MLQVIENFPFYVVLVLLLLFLIITVPTVVTLPSKVFVGREQPASLICEVEGNPTPLISWSPCSGRSVCDKKYFNISKVQTERANYTCTATNALGVDSATAILSKWTLFYTCRFVKFAP